MVDIASIVIAIIALVSSLFTAVIPGWFSLLVGQRNRLADTRKLIAKYRTPLLLAAHDLQSRLYHITDGGIMSWHNSDDQSGQDLTRYTCFLIGQYLAWVSIFRQQAQYLDFLEDKQAAEYLKIIYDIEEVFSTGGDSDSFGLVKYDYSKSINDKTPFRLRRCHQLAIAEIMTFKKDKDEPVCLGYDAFCKKLDDGWKDSEDQQVVGFVINGGKGENWFKPVDDGMGKIVEAEQKAKKDAEKEAEQNNSKRINRLQERGYTDYRLRILQHRLVDLVQLLDRKKRIDKTMMILSDTNQSCGCKSPDCGKERTQKQSTQKQSTQKQSTQVHTVDLEAAS